MSTIEQVGTFFEIVVRIVIEIGFLTFAILFIIGWLRRTWIWTFKHTDNEIEIKAERRN